MWRTVGTSSTGWDSNVSGGVFNQRREGWGKRGPICWTTFFPSELDSLNAAQQQQKQLGHQKEKTVNNIRRGTMKFVLWGIVLCNCWNNWYKTWQERLLIIVWNVDIYSACSKFLYIRVYLNFTKRTILTLVLKPSPTNSTIEAFHGANSQPPKRDRRQCLIGTFQLN